MASAAATLPEAHWLIRITEAISSEVKLVDELSYKAGCNYLLDRDYVDYKRLYHIEQRKGKHGIG